MGAASLEKSSTTILGPITSVLGVVDVAVMRIISVMMHERGQPDR